LTKGDGGGLDGLFQRAKVLQQFYVMPEVNLRWKTEENENTKEENFITIGKYSSGKEGGDS